jgi:serine protease AprX
MSPRMRASWWLMPVAVLVGLMIASPVDAKPQRHKRGKPQRVEKLDKELRSRSAKLTGTSRVIVTLKPGQENNASQEVRRLGGRMGRRLQLLNGMTVELPNRTIKALSERSEVLSIHYDRPISAHMNRAAVSVGARSARSQYGYDGAGIGVAVIDSGITHHHDDLGYQGSNWKVRVVNGQRVTGFVDFVNNGLVPYDDNGHGTHVAGIIAGDGNDSGGARAGIAPAAHIVSLKVLDGQGRGVISDVIAAFEWAVANRVSHNIRVINLSVGARVTESYMTDPLTLAAKRATDAGIVVVTAAGNLGKKANGATQYGGITAPGNAPWVLTVGASSTEGTAWRWDDKIAGYSSRGPSAVDFESKPDLVAPGTGIVSITDPSSEFYRSKAAYLLKGTRWTPYKPYLSLSGTSMASPVVAGTVALMIQANPKLTPNLVKAILQYTSQRYNYDALTQGAGFLNAHGAIELARFYGRAKVGDRIPSSWAWSKQINWGNYRLKNGVIKPNGSAWKLNVVWGTVDDENIVWGTQCGDDCQNIVWGTLDAVENIVWGTIEDGENIVWGTSDDGENIVWGTLEDVENIVWGTNCGGDDCENIVWGTLMDLENIVWGTALDEENIVWGTSSLLGGLIWGSAAEGEDVTWGSNGEDADLFDAPNADPVIYDGVSLDELFGLLPPPSGGTAPAGTTPTTTSSTGTTSTTTIVNTLGSILGGGL